MLCAGTKLMADFCTAVLRRVRFCRWCPGHLIGMHEEHVAHTGMWTSISAMPSLLLYPGLKLGEGDMPVFR